MQQQSDVFDPATAAGRLMAATDWAATPVGEPSTWPGTLRVLVRTIQSSRYPMLILWGEQFTQIYNDAYSALIGDRHPAAMGEDCRVTLAEGWPVLGPLIAEAMDTGVASWVPALQLLLDRAGYREEAYFSVSHGAVGDDDGVTRGVLTVCSEVTEQVVGERRLRLLQDVSLTDDSTLSVDEVAARLLAAVAAQPLDVPFAGLYLREGDLLRRIGTSVDALPGVVAASDAGAADTWGVAAAARGTASVVPVPAGTDVVGGAFAERVTEAYAIPIPSGDPRTPLGVLVSGVSPSRALDELYRSFLGLLAQQVGTALRNALAYEEERARAEALAELDRVKTEFFTNVSHEFRTPLTLMLGPLGDALDDAGAPLPDVQRERVTTALRASRRLLKLVNNLLTFSSLEAGATEAEPEVVDLPALTTDVVSGFRSAVERGGLALRVDCAPLPPVVIDPVHWETITTNLLSNALKFTFTGGIDVRLDGDAEEVRLTVADTGVGIAAEELPQLFDRFHRARGTRSRSHEGSGIGLALVHELTTLHGGTVDVTSQVGAGTTFTVRVPVRTARPGEAPVRAVAVGHRLTAAVEEAESWTPEEPDQPDVQDQQDQQDQGAEAGAGRTRVLVADDNADMREHVTRLLRGEGWDVTAVADGGAALAAALREPPDLLLTDVMMPGVDGFELLRALRADPRTATLPIVVLSARAGEGASAEGLDLGADDYVVKPFSSADLLARLRTTLRLARQRGQHVADLHDLADAAALITSGRRLDDALASAAEQVRALLSASEVVLRLRTSADGPDVTYRSGAPATGREELLATTVRGRDDRDLGTLEVRLAVSDALRPQARALLEPLTRVVAAVVEEGWHAERDVAVASTLQRALLPERLPDVPGLRMAAAYRPAERSVQVGGDWYDVLALPDGRVALCIGDVAGQGLTSALVMGQLRTAVRAYALEGLGPGESVAALDELMGRMPDASFTTLFLGYLDVVSGALTWCSAGHPPPVLVDAGRAELLEGEVTPPLGAAFGVAPAENSSRVPAGARLVAYTDGLVEDRASQLDRGMDLLLRALGRSVGGLDVQPLVEEVLDLLGGRERTDDIAVLAVQRTPAAPASTLLLPLDLELDLPRTPEAGGRARREVRPRLLAAGVTESDAFELLVSLTEAVNNAVEHAVDPTRDRVLVRVHVDEVERRVRVEVQDFGRWRERRPSMDRGHGAALMSAGGEVRVVPGETGTLVVLERAL